jgi:hypothetical protein
MDRESSVENVLDKTHVPDKLYAYTLQIRHMMYELISLDLDKIVSTEAYEDVAVEDANQMTVEQIKSVQSDNNPISNHATGFWKTLYNWLMYVNSGTLVADKTQFYLLIVSDRNIKPGTIAEKFSNANDSTSEEALTFAKDTLLEDRNELVGERKAHHTYLSSIFDSNNIESMKKIIANMKIKLYPKNYDDNLYRRFCAQTIPLEYHKELFYYMLGWVTDCVNNQIKNGVPAFISCQDFHDILVRQISYYDQKGVLAWTQTQPSIDVAEKEVERHDVYIKQLIFIDMDLSEQLQAASDYLRASAQKTIWADKGEIAPQSMDDYHNHIERVWKNQKRIVDLSSKKHTKTESGQILYAYCQNDVVTVKLHGNEVPEFLGSGSLHALANEPRIGWHPDYENLITKELS